jgi:hypothetical protein
VGILALFPRKEELILASLALLGKKDMDDRSVVIIKVKTRITSKNKGIFVKTINNASVP